LNACDSAPDLYSGTAQNTRKRAVTTEKKASALVALVDKAEAEDQYDAHRVTWARRPQSFYAEELGVSLKTIGRYTDKKPFVKLVKSLNGAWAKGGGTITLLRTGEAPGTLADNHAKNVMIKIWDAAQDKIDNPGGKWVVEQKGGQCLWGFAKDIRLNIGDKLGFPAEWSRELSIATFRHALFNWPIVAGTMKFFMEATPDYKPPFLKTLSLPHLASFSEAAVYAYVMHVQEAKKAPLALENLLDPMVSQKVLNLIEGMMPSQPGLTPEINKAIDAGYAFAENTAAGTVLS
jgi:hypothetical protein